MCYAIYLSKNLSDQAIVYQSGLTHFDDQCQEVLLHQGVKIFQCRCITQRYIVNFRKWVTPYQCLDSVFDNARFSLTPLDLADEMFKGGERKASVMKDAIESLIRSHPFTEIDYVSLCDAATLEDLDTLGEENLLALAVKVGGAHVAEVTAKPVGKAFAFFDRLELTRREQQIAAQVLKEIKERLSFLQAVGLDYLNLDRPIVFFACQQ